MEILQHAVSKKKKKGKTLNLNPSARLDPFEPYNLLMPFDV